MNEHLDEELISAVADGEEVDDAAAAHLRTCAQCANAVTAAMRFKRAVRDAMPRYPAPAMRIGRPSRVPWLAAAAVIAAALLLGSFASRRSATRELIDLHTTIVGSTNPIDVISTDRHTVKPWFEGKVPFRVDVPEFAGTPFNLVGGRVVFWRGQPGAYLLIAKGAHRVSLFVFGDDSPRIGGIGSMNVQSWRSNGLVYVAVSDLPDSDLAQLQRAFEKR